MLLARVAKAIDDAGLRYVLIGGQAVVEQGYVRTTEDIDFEVLLPPWDARRLGPILASVGLEPILPSPFETAERIHLLPAADPVSKITVDLALVSSEYAEQAIARATRREVAGYIVAVAAVEDLVIRKVIANRDRDRNDVDQLLLRHGGRVDVGYTEAWLARFEEVVEEPLVARFRELLEASRR